MVSSSFVVGARRIVVGVIITWIGCKVLKEFVFPSTAAIPLVEAKIVEACTAEERNLLSNSTFLSSPVMTSKLSRYPLTSWRDRLILEEQTHRPKSTYRVITVGCGTGINTVGTARMLSRNPVFDKNTWYNQICQVAGVASFTSANRTHESLMAQITLEEGEPKFAVDVHCVEPLGVNFNMVNKAATKLAWARHGFHAHQYAISYKAGTAKFQAVAKPGAENFGIGSCQHINCDDIEMITVDELGERIFEEGNSAQVDLLLIDAEGYDSMALRGAEKTLRNTRLIEFEYNEDWGRQTLNGVAGYLASLGFVCYYEGQEELYRINKGCWIPQYEAHVWSNIACVQEDEVHWLSVMESTFKSTLDGLLGQVH